MIQNIQVLRGLAALSVVYYHTGFVLYKGVHTDFQGVSVFFIISGFIMTYITQSGNRAFLMRRIIRIVPLYWIITSIAFLCFSFMFPILGHFIHNRAPLHSTTFLHQFVEYMGAFQSNGLLLLKSFLFIPYQNEAGNIHPYLEVGWTLNLEMFFYLIIGVALLFHKKGATLLACLILIGIKILDYLTAGNHVYVNFYSHGYTTFFILGVISYYAWLKLAEIEAFKKRRILLPIGFVMLFSFLAINVLGMHSNYLSLLLPFSIILFALLFHSAGLQCTWKPAIALGDSSYALYLTHTVWIGVQQPLSITWMPILKTDTITGMFVALIISCIIGLFVHYHIEKPIIRILQTKLLTR